MSIPVFDPPGTCSKECHNGWAFKMVRSKNRIKIYTPFLTLNMQSIFIQFEIYPISIVVDISGIPP
jgi:hypothetical protein